MTFPIPGESRWRRLRRVRRVKVVFLRPAVTRDYIHVFLLGVIVPWWRYSVCLDRGEWSWGAFCWIWRCGRIWDVEVTTRG